MTTPEYCFDTSAILEGWVRFYPHDIFPALWENIDNLIDANLAVSPDEVLRELEKKDDGAYHWAKARPKMFIPLHTDLQNAVSEILAACPRLIDSKKGKSQGDPFVIGLAKIRKITVVTAEKPTGSMTSPKIPDVCNHYRIRCISLIELIREQNWRF